MNATVPASGDGACVESKRIGSKHIGRHRIIDLVLVRHPEVAIAPGICYGRSNVLLNEPAGMSAKGIAAQLEALQVSGHLGVYSSPLDRCATVAAALASQWAMPCHIEDDLVELDFGDWELRRWDDIDRIEIDAWAADLEHGRPHGGESAAAVAQRAQRWLARACESEFAAKRRATPHDTPRTSSQNAARTSLQADRQTVVAVTHAGVIRMLASRLLEESIADGLKRPLDFGAVCRFTGETVALESTGASIRWSLQGWNLMPGAASLPQA
ncbi:alpha-ribazole phosphatase [Pararobbsia alpina]|uniref:histidine phosphatase family protein n=1 Tax=Pararobbsia alpina TaxID=621374 RepID=UPI0039A60E3B